MDRLVLWCYCSNFWSVIWRTWGIYHTVGMLTNRPSIEPNNVKENNRWQSASGSHFNVQWPIYTFYYQSYMVFEYWYILEQIKFCLLVFKYCWLLAKKYNCWWSYPNFINNLSQINFLLEVYWEKKIFSCFIMKQIYKNWLL